MVVLETPTFTRQITRLLDPEGYRLLQLELVDKPQKGPVIPRSGGLRKIRWQAAARGKRGGIRVIYYWIPDRELILMLLAYPKTVQDDLTSEQRACFAASSRRS
ncbi:MAG: hypothetical protein ACE5JR_13760 [Gemmatimonadota bacterium]